MSTRANVDLDRTLLPGSSLSLFGRALHRAGSRRMAGYIAREAVFVRRGQRVSAAPVLTF